MLPFVAEEPCFALKVGTAINLFERDVPRLSVDIDLTYLPSQQRDPALETISAALARIKARIEESLPPTRVTLVRQGEGLEVKLHCQRFRTQIKIEVNPVLRGHLLEVRLLPCSEKVQELFGRFVETTVVSRGELFGGKLCAALDRQHPRDLFDVKLLLEQVGQLPEDIRLGMIASLVSHGRPIAELVRPRLKNSKQSFQTEFEGMSFEPFTYDDHVATFERLKDAIAAALDGTAQDFLISFEGGEPNWTLFPVAGLQALSGPMWKLHNIRRLQEADPARHRRGVEALEIALSES